jgi:hypothetical protein
MRASAFLLTEKRIAEDVEDGDAVIAGVGMARIIGPPVVWSKRRAKRLGRA